MKAPQKGADMMKAVGTGIKLLTAPIKLAKVIFNPAAAPKILLDMAPGGTDLPGLKMAASILEMAGKILTSPLKAVTSMGMKQVTGAISGDGGDAITKSIKATGKAAGAAVGKGMEGLGVGAEAAGTAGGALGTAAGGALTGAGSALNATVIGAIIGIPMTAVGIAAKVGGQAIKVAGSFIGKAMKILGPIVKALLKAITAVLATVSKIVGKAVKFVLKTGQKAMKLVKRVKGTIKKVKGTVKKVTKPLRNAITKFKMLKRRVKQITKPVRKAFAVAKKVYKGAKKVGKVITAPVRITKKAFKIVSTPVKAVMNAGQSLNKIAEATRAAGKGDIKAAVAHAKGAYQSAKGSGQKLRQSLTNLKPKPGQEKEKAPPKSMKKGPNGKGIFASVRRMQAKIMRPIRKLQIMKHRLLKPFRIIKRKVMPLVRVAQHTKRVVKIALLPTKLGFRIGKGVVQKAITTGKGVHAVAEAASTAGKGDLGRATSQAYGGVKQITSRPNLGLRQTYGEAKHAIQNKPAKKPVWTRRTPEQIQAAKDAAKAKTGQGAKPFRQTASGMKARSTWTPDSRPGQMAKVRSITRTGLQAKAMRPGPSRKFPTQKPLAAEFKGQSTKATKARVAAFRSQQFAQGQAKIRPANRGPKAASAPKRFIRHRQFKSPATKTARPMPMKGFTPAPSPAKVIPAKAPTPHGYKAPRQPRTIDKPGFRPKAQEAIKKAAQQPPLTGQARLAAKTQLMGQQAQTERSFQRIAKLEEKLGIPNPHPRRYAANDPFQAKPPQAATPAPTKPYVKLPDQTVARLRQELAQEQNNAKMMAHKSNALHRKLGEKPVSGQQFTDPWRPQARPMPMKGFQATATPGPTTTPTTNRAPSVTAPKLSRTIQKPAFQAEAQKAVHEAAKQPTATMEAERTRKFELMQEQARAASNFKEMNTLHEQLGLKPPSPRRFSLDDPFRPLTRTGASPSKATPAAGQAQPKPPISIVERVRLEAKLGHAQAEFHMAENRIKQLQSQRFDRILEQASRKAQEPSTTWSQTSAHQDVQEAPRGQGGAQRGPAFKQPSPRQVTVAKTAADKLQAARVSAIQDRLKQAMPNQATPHSRAPAPGAPTLPKVEEPGTRTRPALSPAPHPSTSMRPHEIRDALSIRQH